MPRAKKYRPKTDLDQFLWNCLPKEKYLWKRHKWFKDYIHSKVPEDSDENLLYEKYKAEGISQTVYGDLRFLFADWVKAQKKKKLVERGRKGAKGRWKK